MNTLMGVDYFIRKFEPIPEYNWTVNTFVDYDKCCANGHCGIYSENQTTEEAQALITVLRNTIITPKNVQIHFINTKRFNQGAYSFKAALINDGETKEYQQPTPKQRILAALYDIKAMETPQPAAAQIVTERIRTVYVAVPETIKEQAKELVMQ